MNMVHKRLKFLSIQKDLKVSYSLIKVKSNKGQILLIKFIESNATTEEMKMIKNNTFLTQNKNLKKFDMCNELNLKINSNIIKVRTTTPTAEKKIFK